MALLMICITEAMMNMIYKYNILFLNFQNNFAFTIYFWENICYNNT